ncbi:MAG: 4Fe-4S binding protein, partial [Planctomycetota bacterium]
MAKRPRQRGNVSLPVLESTDGAKRPRSKRGVWRAAVLIGVHIVFAIHITQWLIVGSTLSPVEPSESMQTLEFGAINTGFVFFVLAILSTFLFGRFLCGWGCHVVALQDLCGWMMKKLGTRPKPFRSRLLVWAPLAFGLYMFVWPTFKRTVLFPVMGAVGLERPVWLRDVPELRGFHAELIVTDFWATFPPWFVAIPFFLVIGFVAVYLLGAKGFCTYGCPYGGIFAPTDLASPAKIKVNDNCDASGHCTAVCTSNVRVHEEVRDFGMVVDPGCMKCLDCVSACPTDALSFGYAAPALIAKPRNKEAAARVAKKRKNPKRFDLSIREELALAVVFVLVFLGYRGFLNHVPMLMAAGIAGIGAFLAWKLWSLVAKPNVRLQRLQLKADGRVRVSGVVLGLIAVGVLAGAAWGGVVNSLRWSAHLEHERIRVPLAVVLRPEYAAAPRHAMHADRGTEAFERSRPLADGGVGWSLRP